MPEQADSADQALLLLLDRLRERGYRFVTPTPKTHATVLARDPDRPARSLTEVLGWSRSFVPGTIDPEIEELLGRAGVIEPARDHLRATVRVSSLGDRLFLHSAFPTTAPDAVFFGPDSYRFARFLTEQLHGVRAGSIVDVGTGSGIGAIVAAAALPAASIAMTDINPAALRLAQINAAAAGLHPRTYLGDILADLPGPIDLAIANPPYIVDAGRRAYRDGGGLHGAELSLRMTRAILERLAPGGRFLLYTGSAMVDGQDQFLDLAQGAADAAHCLLDYREIDPDVFGEELEQPAYADVDRIAAVGAVLMRA